MAVVVVGATLLGAGLGVRVFPGMIGAEGVGMWWDLVVGWWVDDDLMWVDDGGSSVDDGSAVCE